MDEPREYPIRRVPRDEAGRLELLAVRPRLWEYLLYGNALYAARAKYENRWRDHQLGYTLKVGAVVDPTNLMSVMIERSSHASAITRNLELVTSKAAHERAFGESEESADAALIEHMATRLMDLYGLLLDWVEETRALRVPDWAEHLKYLVASLMNQPLQRTHDFVDEYISSVEHAIDNLANGQTSTETINIDITYEIEDDLLQEIDRELRRIKPRLHERE
jgi:hypothetical protein